MFAAHADDDRNSRDTHRQTHTHSDSCSERERQSGKHNFRKTNVPKKEMAGVWWQVEVEVVVAVRNVKS
jgi:hypothetical protein